MKSCDVMFLIVLAMPIEMTTNIQKDLTVNAQPKWRFSGLGMRRVEKGVFELKIEFQPGFSPTHATNDLELSQFRDLVVSLVAFSAMTPVELRSKGIFDFPYKKNQRKQTSLGPMNYEFPPGPLSDLSPLGGAMAIPKNYRPILHFLWQALNSVHPFYRFVNLAIAIELLTRHDSEVRHSKYPTCGKNGCKYEITMCPECDGPWRKLPATLRERSAFLFEDTEVHSSFIKQRNGVFHAKTDEPHSKAEVELPELNRKLLLIIRNYLGEKMGMPKQDEKSLGLCLDLPDVVMSIFYTPNQDEG